MTTKIVMFGSIDCVANASSGFQSSVIWPGGKGFLFIDKYTHSADTPANVQMHLIEGIESPTIDLAAHFNLNPIEPPANNQFIFFDTPPCTVTATIMAEAGEEVSIQNWVLIGW